MEAYKDCCDHCGDIVNKDRWTFNLRQCVVCDNAECKSKQNKILRAAISDGVDKMIERMENDT